MNINQGLDVLTLLQDIWFIVLAFIIIVYTILDGFDLGVGFWYFFTREKDDQVTKTDRKILLQSIAPFWDGNEVWLIAAGGILFAAFPDVYATVFSAFYLPLILVVFCLILRATSIEFHEEFDSPLWHRIADTAFIIGSIVPSFSFGVVIGNLVQGMPIDANKNFTGTLFSLFNPYSLLIGLLALTIIITHGAIYIRVRTTGPLQKKATQWAKVGIIAFLACSSISLVISVFLHDHVLENFLANPFLLLIPLLGFVAILITFWHIWTEANPIRTFITSAASIALSILGAGIAVYPNLVFSSLDPNYSLTIHNASASDLGLLIMLVIALIALPLVLIYTTYVYKLFSGKLKENDLGIY
ncbi:MAG: cytochrome d ubiquinol oxidase subunit II [Candidatus Heimdallarchaeota archaeon]|nr:MAG: cytochrome d ubiquinol oxidase subunit II [Candidatus Heimdallarchaeota archaeon]